ncbi:MAG: epimerase [Robiginitomaculum sp.]|nr:MAG: epimerase [Robiginitomaculum sp.]
MTILITGAGGFVGAELVRQLLSRGDKVIAIDRNLSSITDLDQDNANLNCVEIDLTNEKSMFDLFASLSDQGSIKVVHLAAVPGGAAEGNPDLSFDLNLAASLNLIKLASAHNNKTRFVFSSTIAVFGDPLPVQGVDDQTPLRPKLVYGMHKLMMEVALATMTRRQEIDAVSVRLPGIIARPAGAIGMKSAFMSDIFYALKQGDEMTIPVSEKAQLWVMSIRQCVQNLLHALEVDGEKMPETRVVTLPALRVSMGDLAQACAKYCGADTSLLTYDPDVKLEQAFGAHPPLSTKAADASGFLHDGDVNNLVKNAYQMID